MPAPNKEPNLALQQTAGHDSFLRPIAHPAPPLLSLLFGGGGLRGVRSLDEWRFEFLVSAPAPVPRAVIDALLDEAIGWAEDRSLGIGGGYRPATPEIAEAATAWRFVFGLCVRADCRLIPEPQAAELVQALRDWCAGHGLSFAGGFRAFTPEECGQDAARGT